MADLTETLDGVGEGTSTGGAESTASEQQGRQSDVVKAEDFRKYQSNADRRISNAERVAQENAQRAAAYEQQLIDIRMQGLDDGGKLAYQNQLLQRQLGEIQRQRDLDVYAMQRQRDLDDIVKKTGVPLDKIENASNVHEAWQIGYDFKEQSGRSGESGRKADNTVDIGGGKATGKAAIFQSKYDAARKDYDMIGQFKAMAEADEAGVEIKEW
jgi:hypothetical protein